MGIYITWRGSCDSVSLNILHTIPFFMVYAGKVFFPTRFSLMALIIGSMFWKYWKLSNVNFLLTDKSAAKSADTSCSVMFGSVIFVSVGWISSFSFGFSKFECVSWIIGNFDCSVGLIFFLTVRSRIPVAQMSGALCLLGWRIDLWLGC